MPRKRMIDPEFWSDEEIGKWSFSARLFYIGLWNFADDEGRFKAHASLLKSQIFPYDSKISIEKLKKELNNKIHWYEIGGLQYGYIRNFLKYQRIDKPTSSKLPEPPPYFADDSPKDQGGLAPNIIEEKLREEKGKKEKILFSESVLLTEEEHQKLIERYSEELATAAIEELNNHKMSSGKKYKSDYHAILKWAVDAAIKKKPPRKFGLQD